ncbi:MAG: hypothetical protein SGPRY_009792, partial [Prymnesium sp.]
MRKMNLFPIARCVPPCTRPLNDPAADFVSEHGMLPVVAELQVTSSTKIIAKLLQLVNTVVGRGGA